MSVKNPPQPLSKFFGVKNGPGGVKFLSPTSDLETRDERAREGQRGKGGEGDSGQTVMLWC